MARSPPRWAADRREHGHGHLGHADRHAGHNPGDPGGRRRDRGVSARWRLDHVPGQPRRRAGCVQADPVAGPSRLGRPADDRFVAVVAKLWFIHGRKRCRDGSGWPGGSFDGPDPDRTNLPQRTGTNPSGPQIHPVRHRWPVRLRLVSLLAGVFVQGHFHRCLERAWPGQRDAGAVSCAGGAPQPEPVAGIVRVPARGFLFHDPDRGRYLPGRDVGGRLLHPLVRRHLGWRRANRIRRRRHRLIAGLADQRFPARTAAGFPGQAFLQEQVRLSGRMAAADRGNDQAIRRPRSVCDAGARAVAHRRQRWRQSLAVRRNPENL